MNTPAFPSGYAIRTPINQVLRNTYLLLALTLVAGAATAYWALASNARPLNIWIALGFMIGMPFIVNALRNSIAGLAACFVYCAGLGYIAGPIIGIYASAIGPQVPVYAFVTTAVVFFGLTGYVMATRKDFSYMRGFMFAGFIAVVLAIVANQFLQIPLLSVTISTVAVLLAAGGILYSTSAAINGGEDNYIVLAANIYGSIWSLFMNLMNIFGFLSSD